MCDYILLIIYVNLNRICLEVDSFLFFEIYYGKEIMGFNLRV